MANALPLQSCPRSSPQVGSRSGAEAAHRCEIIRDCRAAPAIRPLSQSDVALGEALKLGPDAGTFLPARADAQLRCEPPVLLGTGHGCCCEIVRQTGLRSG